MSRRLRGQTTLQSILGRSTITKKSTNGQQEKRAAGKPGLKTSSSAPARNVPVKDKGGPEKSAEDDKALPEGFIACPICQCQQKEADINAHIGNCPPLAALLRWIAVATLRSWQSSSDLGVHSVPARRYMSYQAAGNVKCPESGNTLKIHKG